MGYRFRKSKSFGPVRVTASKSGIGFSSGVKGFRVTKKAGGGIRTTASIPGTGISYVSETSGRKHACATNHDNVGSSVDPCDSIVAQKPKSRLVALFLCAFFGVFGVHRFYVGKIGTGFLYFCTAGLVGIGWIADFIAILIGRFQDKSGRPLTPMTFFAKSAQQPTANP